VTRLLDIGVKPFLVASSLRAIMAQRLVRTVCESCKEPYELTESDIGVLGSAIDDEENVRLWKGRGCNKCTLTGYQGRKGIFEIFLITDEIQRMIFSKVPSSELRGRARAMGMRTLREDGFRKVIGGVTTVEEILRVTMGDLD
jgi:general secretion pathway protein E/type IV pilus assembly protein PilB